jgi:beta-phosphoglucomutase-like phosphatase (HAD superfamily)
MQDKVGKFVSPAGERPMALGEEELTAVSVLIALGLRRGEAEAMVKKLKARGIKIGLVTSGLYEKAYPEIVAAFDALGMGDPKAFYDAIITAGFPLRQGEVGTLGELSPKPHPWLYAEICRVGLGFTFEDRVHVVGIEDSGAGVCAIRLAGFTTIGLSGGNILESGTRGLCDHYCATFSEIVKILN